MLDAAICSEALLESSHLRAEDELCAIDDAHHCGIDFRLHLLVLRLQIEKRNHSPIPLFLC